MTIGRGLAMGGLLVAWLSAPDAVAGTLALDGNMTQGGLVIGKAEPGARVTIDGTAVRVSGAGAF